jgi:hypothetical protein
VASKIVARAAGVPVIEDNKVPLSSPEVALSEAKRIGFPVIFKASAGGGGRGQFGAQGGVSSEYAYLQDMTRQELERELKITNDEIITWRNTNKDKPSHLVVVLALRRTLSFSSILNKDHILVKARRERGSSDWQIRFAVSSAAYSPYNSEGRM